MSIRFARLSTSTKMLIILSLALLPLGLIASLASWETARTNRSNRVLAAHLLASDSAGRLSLFLDRTGSTLRATSHRGGAGCGLATAQLGGSPATPISVAMFDRRGGRICASRGFAAAPPLRAPADGTIAMLHPERAAVQIVVGTGQGWALAEIPRAMLAEASHPNALDGSYDLRLSDARGHVLPLAALRTVSLGRDVVRDLPIMGGQLRLSMTLEAAPLSANELLLMFLPILMWVSGSALGWLVIDRLVFRPLGELQRAADRYQERGGRFTLPALTTPAHEIRDLGVALSAATDTIARHEADLEDGLARQTRLTREVHHRVKNNLQVVASLLNIHARGARAPEAVAAYGAIQRRVDALALVHRSHYAELEVNRGVALRPLIGELGSNLRGSAPPGLSPPRVLIDVALFSATQDVAVPVAFLVTELLELAMFRLPGTSIAITLAAGAEAGRARLSFTSPAFRPDAAPVDDRYERCERIVGGLARQLRSTLERDDPAGTIALDIAVMTAATDAAQTRDMVIQQRGGALAPHRPPA